MTRNFWTDGPTEMILYLPESPADFPQLENIFEPLEPIKTDVDAEIRAKKSEKRFMAGPGIEPRTPCVIDERSTDLPSSQVTN